jgi:hypothetical protein
MKKVYLFVAAVSVCSFSFSQVKSLLKNTQRLEAEQELGQAENSFEKAPLYVFAKGPGDIIFSENFSMGIGAWTTAGPNGSIWAADNNGPNGQYSAATEKIASTTNANGFVIFDGDLANPGNPPYTNWVGSLVSPIVDMTGITNAILTFEQRYRTCCSGDFYPKVEVSTDGFLTYQEFNVAIPGVVVNLVSAPTTKMKVNIGSFLAASSNPENFQFRFTWDGGAGTSHYHWQIDDVVLFESNENDLTALNKVLVMGSEEIPYHFIPVNQKAPITFSGQVRNDGSTPQTGVNLTVSSNSGGGSVSSSSNNLNVGVTDSLITTSWLPPATVPTDYILTYTFGQNETDASPTDNIITDAIKITRSTYSVDNGIGAGSISNLSTQSGQALKIGNVMQVMANDKIDSMYITTATATSNIGQEIFGEVWRDNGTDWEYLATTPYLTIAAAQNGQTVKLPLENIVNVNAGDLLLVVACHNGSGSASSADVRFRTAQGVEEGIVQGFTANGEAFYLASPSAVMVRLNIQPTASLEENTSTVSIGNVFPNPTSGYSVINYSLASTSDIIISISDVTGKVILTEYQGLVTEGSHSFTFDASNFSNGIYYISMVADDTSVTKKFIKK